MNYSIQLNAVNNPDKNVKAFASVTFGNCFKVTNIALVKSKEGELFVSMPSFKSKERTERNEPVYKDVCNPITAEFREVLYKDILTAYTEMRERGTTEVSRDVQDPQEPDFRVAITPFEREGSNIRGLGRIYFADSFVVNNVSIIQGKDSEFVAIPSYVVMQGGRDAKAQYQDVCFPVTKEFREKLYGAIMDCYHQEREKAMSQGRDQAASYGQSRMEDRYRGQELPFR